MTESLEELLQERRRFFAFVRRRVQDDGLAEDILQTAYLRALEHRDRFDAGESAVAWFYRLLRNAVIDSYRRQTVKDRALEAWARELETAHVPSPEEQVNLCDCLHDVIGGLKPEYAESLRAIDLGEQAVQAFAAEHGITATNASVRVHRARAALRRKLLATCARCAEHGCVNCTCRRHALP